MKQLLLASPQLQVSLRLLTTGLFLLFPLLPNRLLPMFYSSCEFLLMLLASLLNVAGFSTVAAFISDVNGVHVVVGLPSCCCRVAFILAVAYVHAVVAVMLLLPSLLLLVACVTALASVLVDLGVPILADVFTYSTVVTVLYL
jgi:hypothetical protein